MARPLMQKGVTELETMFASAETDGRQLRALATELRHRQVPKAVSLLSKVQERIEQLNGKSGADVEVNKHSAPENCQASFFNANTRDLAAERVLPLPVQTPVFDSGKSAIGAAVTSSSAPLPINAQAVHVQPPAAFAPAPPLVYRPTSVSSAVSADPTTLAAHLQPLTKNDAFRILGVGPGAPWIEVEQARRTLVAKTSPERLKGVSADRRAQAQAEANRTNAAYAVLRDIHL